jgi:hypothetical protein
MQSNNLIKKAVYNIIFVLAITNFTSGCIAAAAAGAAGLAGGGYYAGSKGSDREQMRVEAKALGDVRKEFEEQKAKEKAADDAAASQIAMSYSSGQLVNDIAIYPQVENGVAILYGRAPNEQVVQNAIKIASQTPGVKRIVSNIQVIPAGGYAPAPVAQAAPQPMLSDAEIQQQMQQQFQSQQMQAVQPQAAPMMQQPPQQAPRSMNPAQMQKQSSMRLGQASQPQITNQQAAIAAAPVAASVYQQQVQPQNIQPQIIQPQQMQAQQLQPLAQPQIMQQPATQRAATISNAPVAVAPAYAPAQQIQQQAVEQKGLKRLPLANQPLKQPNASSSNTLPQKVTNSEQKKNQPSNVEKKQKLAETKKAKTDDPPPQKQVEAKPKAQPKLLNPELYEEADGDSAYVDYKPQTIKKQVAQPAAQQAAPQQAPQPVSDEGEYAAPAPTNATPAPKTLNIPAPLITEENDGGYIEYKPKAAPKIVKSYTPPKPAPVQQVQQVQIQQPQVQQQAPRQVSANIVNQAPAPVQQAAPMVHSAPLNIPAPAPAADNDAFYEQFYQQ